MFYLLNKYNSKCKTSATPEWAKPMPSVTLITAADMLLMHSRWFGKGYPDSLTHDLMKNTNRTHGDLDEPLTLKGQVNCSLPH